MSAQPTSGPKAVRKFLSAVALFDEHPATDRVAPLPNATHLTVADLRAVRAALAKATDIAALSALAERVANLNRDAGEIGAGMLASLVDEARAVVVKVTT